MDYKKLLSQTPTIMPDDELKEQVRELARNDAARGEYDFHGKEYTRLRYAFISVASPDRHGIIANHPAFLTRLKFGLTPHLLNFGVATFMPHEGWIANSTSAEAERLQEISDVYHNAWLEARNGFDGGQTVDSSTVQASSRFNIRA